MKKQIPIVVVLFCCLLGQIQTSYAQAPVNLGFLNGKATTLAKPVYPQTAEKSAVGGSVKVNVTIDEYGNVTNAEAVEGELFLRDAALAAARAAKFAPNLVNGKAVKFSGFLVFLFINPKTNFFGNKDQQNSNGTEDQKNDDKKCRTAAFITSTPPLFKDSKLVDAQTINGIIKSCDAAIKAESSSVSRKFYRRALARYYLVRGYDTLLGKTLSDVSSVSAEDVRLALADLEIYLGWTDPENKSSIYDLRKMGNIIAGELIAVTAFKDKKPELLPIALEKLTAAQGFRKDSLLDDPLGKGENEVLNGVIAQDRALIESVLNKNADRTGAAGEEIKNRYQKYVADYASKEAVYKQNLQNFQAVLKAQQTAATPDTAQICQNLASMNTSFQSLKNSFAPIVAMKTKGELTDPNLISQIETRDAQHTRIQTSINAAAAKYGCH